MNASSSSFADVVENAGDTSVVALLDRLTDFTASIIGAVAAALATVTVTPADVAWLPAASRARAATVWEPFGTVVEFQAVVYGAAVASAPTAVPSTRNCTPTTATLSDAVADRLTAVPLTLAPAAGAVIAT